MLAKLIRYEFKALLRILPLFYLALQVLALAAAINNRAGPGVITDVIQAIWQTASGALIIANLVIVVLRFRDNFLKDEGYLMLTLPVPIWELVASKAIAALGTFLLSGIAYLVSLLIFGLVTDFDAAMAIISSLFHYSGEIDYPALIFGILTAAVFIIQQMCLIYASMTAGQTAPRFRGLIGFGVFLAVDAIVEFPLMKAVSQATDTSLSQHIALLLLTTAFAALYFYAASWLLKHRFNLE